MSDHKLHHEETDPLLTMKGWWQKNQKPVIIAVAVVVIAVGGWFGYQKFIVAPKEEQANLAIYHAEEYFRQDSLKQALNGDGPNKGFLYVIRNYGGTDAGNLANYYAGVCYLRTGDFKNAVKYLEDFKTSAKQLKMMAYGALGDAYSELGRNDDAVASYKKASAAFEADEINSSEYLFRAGLLYETLGKNKEAADVFREVKDKFPNSTRGKDAVKHLYRVSDPSQFSANN
ncbi:MAG TPA: tetratricopeptide repeat protein [Chitinophagaceae bacterium]|nr:tetratricopeptide repeat protein [Chitinophagaceae bacterium]